MNQLDEYMERLRIGSNQFELIKYKLSEFYKFNPYLNDLDLVEMGKVVNKV